MISPEKCDIARPDTIASFCVNQSCLSLLIALLLSLCTGCDLMSFSNSIQVVNRSSAEQVALLAVTVDGVKLDYQDPKLAKQSFLTTNQGEFKSKPQPHHIELWIKKENASAEKYSCTVPVQSVSGEGCSIGIDYSDSGIKCSICITRSEETEGMSD